MRISINLINLLTLPIIIMTFQMSYSSSIHCDTTTGRYFYCDTSGLNDELKGKSPNNNKSDEWYFSKLAAIKQTLEAKKTKMVIEPSEENVKEYIMYQQMVMDMSSRVTDQWQRVLWKTPSLDYTIRKPVSKIGKETYLDERKKEKQDTLETLSKRYGIFFVFRSDCPYCHKFAPVVKMLEAKGFNIIPISIDGGLLPEFPKNQTKFNTGQLSKLGIKLEAVPAIFLFDAKTKQVVTIGFGFMAFDETEERIFALTKQVGEDY